MNHYVAILVASILGLILSIAPKSVARLNIMIMEQWPEEKRSEYDLKFWRSRSAMLILRGVGIGMLVWAIAAYATLG